MSRYDPLGVDMSADLVEVEKRRQALDRAYGAATSYAVRSNRAATSAHPPVVYYMRLGTMVKIGTSRNIVSRINVIQPQGVVAIEWGHVRQERVRHAQFDHLRSHREWFNLAPDLMAHMIELRAAFEGQEGITVEDWLKQVGVIVE